MTDKMQPILDRIPDSWGKYVEIPEGWYDKVLELDKKLSEINPDYVVLQCKSKFGGLRYYVEDDQRLSKIIYQYEVESFKWGIK